MTHQRTCLQKPLEEEVEPLGEEADACHHDAHLVRGIVGHGVENPERDSWVSQKGDPEPHIVQSGQLVRSTCSYHDPVPGMDSMATRRAGLTRVWSEVVHPSFAAVKMDM